jgi:hypothetical protein
MTFLSKVFILSIFNAFFQTWVFSSLPLHDIVIAIEFPLHVCSNQRIEDAVADFIEFNKLGTWRYERLLTEVCESVPGAECDGLPPREIYGNVSWPRSPNQDDENSNLFPHSREYLLREGYNMFHVADCICDHSYAALGGCFVAQRLALLDHLTATTSSIPESYTSLAFHSIPMGHVNTPQNFSFVVLRGESMDYSIIVADAIRPEDALANVLYSCMMTLMTGASSELLERLVHNQESSLIELVCSYMSSYHACDGQPSRPVIGVVQWSGVGDKIFFVPVMPGYSAEQQAIFACRREFCSHVMCVLLAWRIQDVLNGASFDASSAIGEEDTPRQLLSVDDSPILRVNEKRALDTPLYGVAISLGLNCYDSSASVALNLRKRKAEGYLTGPFDLILSNYQGMIKCLLEDCAHLTDSSFLELKPVIDVPAVLRREYDGPYIIYNTRYKFVFPHESHHLRHWREDSAGNISMFEHFVANDFFHFKERYNRRWANFMHYIHSGEPILFTLATRLPRMVHGFDEVLQKKYPHLKYNIGAFKLREEEEEHLVVLNYHRTLMGLDESELT